MSYDASTVMSALLSALDNKTFKAVQAELKKVDVALSRTGRNGAVSMNNWSPGLKVRPKWCRMPPGKWECLRHK